MGDDERGTVWRQGDILRPASVKELVKKKILDKSWVDSWAIVISHDCDLAHHDFETEPFAELLRALPLDGKPDGNLVFGKNPRRLHFPAQQGDDTIHLDCAIFGRSLVPRRELLKYTPDDTRSLTKRTRREVTLWLIKRYRREAFPDAFNRRISAGVESAIRDSLRKQGGTLMSGIYLMLNSEEELAPGDTYVIGVCATMPHEDHQNTSRQSEAHKALDKVVTLLNSCDGIDVMDSSIVSEAGMTVDDILHWKAWDYDDLSIRDDEGIGPTAYEI